MSISSPSGTPSPNLIAGLKGLTPKSIPKRKKPEKEPNNGNLSQGHPAQTISEQLIVDPTLQEDLKRIEDDKLKKSLSSWVKQQYEQMKSATNPLHQQWYLNHAFYRGRQYTDVVGGKFMPIPSSNKNQRLVVNRIEPAVRTEVARMTAQDPNAEVVPSSSENSDIEAAKAAEALIQSAFITKSLKAKFNRAAFWTSVTGNGYIKTYWDGSIPVETQLEDGTKGKAMGDINYQVVLPFNLFVPDPSLEDIEDQPYVFNVYTKPVSWVNQRWANLFPNKTATATVSTQTDVVDSYKLSNRKASSDAKPDSCLVIEAWIKPGFLKDLPNGGMLTVVNNEVIVQAVVDGFPYAHGEYPFTKFDSVQTGTFFSASIIESLIPLQRELNRNRSRRAEVGNVMGNPGLMYRRGSLDPQKVTNKPGELLEVMPGAEWPVPKPQAVPQGSTAQDAQELLSDFEDVSGQHQVSKGSAPTGVTAATAIQYLSEQDNTYMSTTFDSVEAGMQKIARQTIQLFIQYASVPRLIKVGGRNNIQSLDALSGSDVRGATDVRVEAGSSLPTSRAAYVAMITDFMTRGFVDPQMGFEMIGLPNFQSYFELTKLDENQALRENMKFEKLDPMQVIQARSQAEAQKNADLLNLYTQMNGSADGLNSEEDLKTFALSDPQAAQVASQYDQPMIPINDFDDHDVHIEVHNRFRKSQTYESMPSDLQDEIDRHVDAHESARQQKMLQEQMLAAGMMPGEASDMIGDVESGAQGEGPDSAEAAGMEQADANSSPGGSNQFSGTPEQNTSENEPATPTIQ